MDDILKDERFKHIAKDHRFRNMPKSERKFKVDGRFKNMFHDKKFKLKYSVDKRGRPVNLTTNENLKKYYDLSSEESDEEDDKKEEKKVKVKKAEEEVKTETESETEDEEDVEGSESDEENSKSEEEAESSDDSSDGSDDDEDLIGDTPAEEIPWNELDQDAPRSEDISHRLALCNMDWDRIKPRDVFMLLNSFKPPQGVIKSIKVYISEYGKERLEYERLHGPKELTEGGEDAPEPEIESESDEELDEDEEGNRFDRRKLRIYQFNRLKYFYAVIECDSSETANKIYTECDGMEYESSSTRIDLRFIPNDVVFDDADLKEACLEAPDPVSYKPNLFFTSALNQTKVECTWDETPRDRLAITMKTYTEEDLKNTDFRGIIATSSEEEDEDDDADDPVQVKQKEKPDEKKENGTKKDEEDERLRKYRELLLGVEAKSKKSRDADLEFSWEGGIKENGFDDSLFDSKQSSKKSSKKEAKRELTDEEKKEQARLSMLTMDSEDEKPKSHFNLDDLLVDAKKTKNKKKKRNEPEVAKNDEFQLNINDPRFEAIFKDHKFNIDPSDQSFKKTKAMEQILNEKIKRIQSGDKNNNDQANHEDTSESSQSKTNNTASSQQDPHISLMVKSIKSKAEILKRKKEEINNIKKKLKMNKR